MQIIDDRLCKVNGFKIFFTKPIDKVNFAGYTCPNLKERTADSDMNNIFWRLLRANFRNGRMCTLSC